MTPSDRVDWVSPTRYVAGECTAEESAAVDTWRAGSPERQALVESARTLWRASGEARGRVDVDAAKRRLHEHIAADTPSGRRPSTIAIRKPRRASVVSHQQPWVVGVVGGRAAWQWAAATLVAISLGVTIGVGRRGAGAIRQDREYATAAGQRLSVTLIDGTQVTLAPASRVRVAADYGRPGREVELEGEAYFAVVHDGAHPFAVRVHGAVARDVGTAFDVRAYGEDAGARIAVAEGAVVVSAERQQGSCLLSARSALLSREACSAPVLAGDVAKVAPEGITVAHGSDIATLTRWTTGTLVYHDEHAATVVADIQRWYNVNLIVDDASLARRTITMTVTPGEPINQVLDVLCDLLGAHLDRRGSRLTLIGGGPSATTYEPGTP